MQKIIEFKVEQLKLSKRKHRGREKRKTSKGELWDNFKQPDMYANRVPKEGPKNGETFPTKIPNVMKSRNPQI